ncbi:phosphoribosylglycinamide formyltransferase [Oceanicella sp. SM1341]|uniref:phosphoribosylglycinamide formyltransferase n=1 Tax=Oceanicella sp. SM1341 TaxID=1548889 RepID=UPI0027120476|nr:phosphoribosylglycinamide formyltransferase [Oceanicella sp. SM1341]
MNPATSLPRVAILISGGGSNMLSLVRAMQSGAVAAEPALVLSNRPDAGGLAKAEALGVPTAVVDHKPFRGDREAFDAAVQERLAQSGADIVCLAGFMRILTPGFIAPWEGRMLNIHPSLLPLFRGLHTHERALEAGMAVHGCTVHEVTAELDGGPIRGQAVIAVEAGDTPDTLAARLLPMEHRLYPAVLARFVRGERAPLALFG